MANLTDYDREWLAKNAMPEEFYQIGKKLGAFGQKAYQRDDTEDRALPYRNWIREQKINGYFMDIDFFKFKFKNGKPVPVAITELTRCDAPQIKQSYLDAIYERFFVRDGQGRTVEVMSALLDIPAYLVVFQVDMKWVWVYSFRKKAWREFSADEWAEFINSM